MEHDSTRAEPGRDDPIEAIQRAEQAERLAAVSDFEPAPKKRRRWLKATGVLLVILLVIVGLAPTIAGPALRPMVEKRLAASLDATVRIDRLAVGWFQGPRVEGLRILDRSLQEQANLTLRGDTPLFRLAMAPRELGTFTVSGSLILERRPDGSISPLPRPGPDEPGPVELPDIGARLIAERLDIEWRETDQQPVRLAGISGELRYQQTMVSGALTFDLAHALGRASVSIDANASELATENDTLVFGSGRLAVSVDGDDARLALDALLLRSDAGYRVTLSGDEASARLGGPVLAALAPALNELTRTPVTVADGREFTLDALPGVSLRLTDAAATLDAQTFALSDTRFEAVIETGELSGSLDGKPWAIDPLLASAATRNLIDGVDVEAVTSVTLDGARAGELSLLADGLRVLRPDGSFMSDPTSMIAGSRTTLDVTEMSTVVIEPLLAPLLARTGIVPSRDLGPTVSAEFAVTSGAETGLRFELASDNASAAVGLRVIDGVLRTTNDASRIEIRSAAGFATDLLERAGVSVDEGAAIDVRLGELAFDLDAQTQGEPLDLRALSGVVSVGIGRTAGRALVDGVERSFVLRPSEAEIDLRRIGERATLVAGAAVEVDGRAAGTLNVSVDAAGLLDERGSIRPGVPALSGEVALRNVRTALVDPWLEATGVSASRLLGESADLLIIGTRGSDERVALQTTLRSGGLTGGGDLIVADGTLRSAGVMRFEHPRAGSIAADLLAGVLADTVTTSPDGTLTLELDALEFGPAGFAAFDAAVKLQGLSLAGPTDDPTAIERLNATLSLAGGRGAIEINGLGAVGRSPVIAGGRMVFAVSGGDAQDAPLWWLGPIGQIDVTIPTAAAALVAPEAAERWRELAGTAIGDTLDVSLAATDGAMTLRMAGSSDATRAELRATTDGRSLRIEGGSVETTITQEAVRQIRLARAVNTGVEGSIGASAGPVLASSAELGITLSGFGLIDDGRFAPSGSAALRLSASGAVEGLHEGTVMGSDGLPRTVREGAFGIEGLLVECDLPIGAMLSDQAAALSGTVRGTLTGEAGQAIGALTGAIDAALEAGALAGPLSLTIALPDIDTAQLDDALRTDSFVAGLLGASASATVELAGLGEAGRVSDAGLTIELSSPRLAIDGPMVFDIQPDRVVLASKAELRYTVDPVFATRHLLNQLPGEERVRLAEPVRAALVLDRLTLGRDGAPFRPGLFDAHAAVSAPALVVEQRAEVEPGVDVTTAAWLRTDLSPVTGELVTDPDRGATLKLNAAQGAEPSLLAEISLRGVSAGVPVLGVLVEGRRVPTQAIDAIADFDGLLAEIVGPFAEVRLSIDELSHDTGGVNFSLIGDRASASFIGRVEAGVLQNDDPIVAQVDVIRPQLGARLARAVPALGRITKVREDGPATLTALNVRLPLGAEQPFGELDADVTIDIGNARFQASTAFGELLKIAQQPVDNEVGRTLQPMISTVRQGQITYERFKIPLGEFTLLSEGAYHLTTKRTDITTYIPVGALSDKAMGVLSTGLGSQFARLIPGLERVTMIPWRVTGVPGNLTIRPDIEALRKDLTNLLNPFNLIDGVIGGAQSIIQGGGRGGK